MKVLRILAAAVAAVLIASTMQAANPAAPSAYPKRLKDWPGAGEVRVYEWMAPKRREFWNERAVKQGSVVFAGDSQISNWYDLADDFKQFRVANRGISGDVSRGLLFRFDEDVLALHPRAIVLLVGLNDLTARQAADVTMVNIRAIAERRKAQTPGAPMFVCTVPPSANADAPVDSEQLNALNQQLRKLTEQYSGVYLVDLYAATATAEGAPDKRYFEDDQLHLNAAGRARWKQLLIPAMQRAGLM